MVILATLAGGTGAVVRYLTSGWVQRRIASGFPWGTMAVNLSGALLLGWTVSTMGSTAGGSIVAGFLGGYTTFSTWMVESLDMLMESARRRAATNLVVMALGGLGAAWIGYAIGRGGM